MTTKDKGRNCEHSATPNTSDTANHSAIAHLSAWQLGLAAGNPNFRRNGAYDAVATGRKLRRFLEKKARKASSGGTAR